MLWLWHAFVIILCIRTAICNLFIAYVTLIRGQFVGARIEALPTGLAFSVVLPVYEEVASVQTAVRHLKLVTPSPTAIYIVGNSRERTTSGINPTLDAASLIQDGDPNVILCEYMGQHGRRPHQINYALSNIRSPKNRTWVLMVDVDSRLSNSGINELLNAIIAGHDIIHQPALFLGNFSSASFLQRGHALYQSRWTIAHEMRRIMTHNSTKCFISHLVGHGLCIRLDTLESLGGMPTDAILEDMLFGYFAAAFAKKVHVLRSFEIGDSPTSWWGGFEQQLRWASGIQQYPSFYSRIVEEFPDSSKLVRYRGKIVAVYGTISSIAWNMTSYVYLAAVWGMVNGDRLSTIYVLLYMAEFQQCSFFFQKRKLIKTRDFLLTPMYIFMELMRHSVPANVALFNRILNRPINLKKATHYTED